MPGFMPGIHGLLRLEEGGHGGENVTLSLIGYK
jgi:hypothetical protein